MPQHLKALIVVMLITALTFPLARPLMRRFMADADITVRRNVWLGMTLAAFLIPNYWAYVVVACLVLAYGVKRDSNPAALYVFLLLAMVPIGLDIPTFGIVRQIFLLDHFQLLSLVILVPVAFRLGGSSSLSRVPAQRTAPGSGIRFHADLLVILYLVSQVVLLLPYESITSTLRRVVLSGLDVWLPYFVLSRSCRTREHIVEVMAAFAFAMFLLTPLAVFEVGKGWLLYAGLQEQWGTAQIMSYLRRGDFLRAQLTAGHSIVLGFAMTIGFGFWLYLQSQAGSFRWRTAAMLTLLVGMVLPSARGPWLGAIVVLLVFLALGPNRGRRIFRAVGLLGFLSAIAIVSPYGDQIVERLPFVGTLDEGTVAYRQQLASMSWLLIQQNPWFGTPGFIAYLEGLRQGQGIVDLVNAYAGIALAYGLFTLAAFVGFLTLIVVSCIRGLRRLAATDPDLSLLGASLVACLAGSLLMIATVNLYLSVAYLVWSLAGLGLAYAQLARERTLESPGGALGIGAATSQQWLAPGLSRATPTRPE